MSTRMKKAGGGNPPAATLEQQSSYRRVTLASTVNPLDQAADVLCLLALFPLTETARTVLFALLERRLRRAYAA